MILYLIHRTPFLRKLYFQKAGRPFVRKKIRPVVPHLSADQKILDIGSGNGLVAKLLREKGLDIVPVDIHEGQYDESVKPMLYDGKHLPFPDKSFDCGLILTVLHHVDEPDALLRESARVCRQLIIMEDIYKNAVQKQLTFFVDSLANLFYSPCPHTNKNDKEWKATFQEMGFRLKGVHYRKVIFFIRQAIYVVDTDIAKSTSERASI